MTLELADLRPFLFLAIAAIFFVAFLAPSRNAVTRFVRKYLTRRSWEAVYPARVQLFVGALVFALIAVIDFLGFIH